MEPKLSSDLLRGHTDTIVLAVLMNSDRYGLEIYNRISARTGEQYEVKVDTLYSSYKRLERFGIFLILTEKDRSKPWLIKQREEHMKYASEQFDNPAQAQKFGLICGALWIAAIAGFVLLSMLVGIKFSWLAIVAALVIQMIVMAMFTKSR